MNLLPSASFLFIYCLSSTLAIGFIGINDYNNSNNFSNAYAQEDFINDLINETIVLENIS